MTGVLVVGGGVVGSAVAWTLARYGRQLCRACGLRLKASKSTGRDPMQPGLCNWPRKRNNHVRCTKETGKCPWHPNEPPSI